MGVLKMQPAGRESVQPPAAKLELSRLTSALSTLREAPLPEVPALLFQLASVQASLYAAQACLVGRMLSSRDPAALELSDHRWLTTDEAAELLKVDRKWLYRRAKSLPFSRRLSRKKLLFSEVGLREWMKTRRA